MNDPKILDHLDHARRLEVATYGGPYAGPDGDDVDSITVECTQCGEVVVTLWERGAENDENREERESELQRLEATFAEAGGRGVELAERIDELRKEAQDE
jgi:hypothetical protein